MPSNADLTKLVGLVYEAVDDPGRWPTFLEHLSEAIAGICTVLQVDDLVSRDGSISNGVRVDWNVLRDYEYYSKVNIWLVRGGHLLTEGRVLTGEMVCSDREVEQSEYYNDYLRPAGLYYTSTAVVLSERRTLSLLTSFRPRNAEPFDGDELLLMQTLLPHIKRAVQLSQRLAAAQGRADGAERCLGLIPTPALLVDGDARIIMMNDAAIRLLNVRDGLALDQSRLSAARHSDTTRLRTAIAAAAAMTAGRHLDSGTTMTIARPSLARPLEVIVSPCPRSEQLRITDSPALAIVLVSDPERRPIVAPARLQELLGLTSTEAAIASQLAAGASLKEIAKSMGVTVHTIRWHAKRIFAKTGTNSQAQLVTRVLTTPAALAESRDAGAV